MTAPDLNRADALAAEDAARVALGGLFHYAFAGALAMDLPDEDLRRTVMLAVAAANENARGIIALLGAYASQLPA